MDGAVTAREKQLSEELAAAQQHGEEIAKARQESDRLLAQTRAELATATSSGIVPGGNSRAGCVSRSTSPEMAA